MAELEAEVARLRAAGAAKIVVGGQSFGANMALVYGARHPEVDGIVALAPGHFPERFVHNPEIVQSVDKARSLIAAGKGQQTANFDDVNQGRSRQVSAKPAVYLSFFDPQGGAIMSRNAARLAPHTAFLCIVGAHDQGNATSEGAIFHQAPKNPQDRKSTRLNSSHEWISRMPSSA